MQLLVRDGIPDAGSGKGGRAARLQEAEKLAVETARSVERLVAAGNWQAHVLETADSRTVGRHRRNVNTMLRVSHAAARVATGAAVGAVVQSAATPAVRSASMRS
jgi:hypothetical protein